MSGESLQGAGVAVAVEDVIDRRVLESVFAQLHVTCTLLDSDQVRATNLEDFELLVADEGVIADLRAMPPGTRDRGGPSPAFVSIWHDGDVAGEAKRREPDPALGPTLWLPMQPSALAAQLSVILYSHRAFVEQYRSAFDELNLNRQIFRSVTSGISVADVRSPELPLLYVNPAFEVMTGYRLEEVQGRNCRFLQGKEVNQAGIDELRRAISEGRETTVLLRNYRKNGTLFWNELSLSPIRNGAGQLTHFVGIQNDVTARVDFEAALRESEKLAAVGRLASSIAHEINNPLESVMNLLYLAQEAEPNPDTKHYLTLADQELQRVALITSQSLRFYKQSTKPQTVRTHDLLQSVLSVYESQAANANVQIHRCRHSDAAVLCLESEIRQVLNNLVRNAIEAMTGFGGRLTVRTRAVTDWPTGRRGSMLTVADTGVGMDSLTLENLFKPFQTTKGIAGTGLGLWISQEIVRRHHGRLRVRSAKALKGPSGTVFQMFLPAEGPPPELAGETVLPR